MLGDKKTIYFHAVASSKNHKRRITSIEVEGTQLTDINVIIPAFTEYYRSIIRMREPTTYDLINIIQQRQLLDMDSPLTVDVSL
jgi:hypothetical protein